MAKKGEYKKGATADSIRQRKYNGSPEQLKRRAERNSSRAEVAKKVGKSAIKGKDVDHKNHNTADKKMSNLQAISPSKNRAMNQYDKRKRTK